MECDQTEICAPKLEQVENEMEHSLKHISTQKNLGLSGVKIYLAVLSGLLAYAAFVQTKIIAKGVKTPSDEYMMFAVFGIMATFLVFLLGWILLDYITGIVFTSIVHYKHVSNMRSVKADVLGERFINKCIVPIAARKLPMKRSRQLPALFSIINLLLLCANYYFFSLFLTSDYAMTYALIIIALFAIYYPNVCAKYDEEITIAQRMRPGKDEVAIRRIVRTRIEKNKKELIHKTATITLFMLFMLYFSMLGYNLYKLDQVQGGLSSFMINLEIAFLIVLSGIRYFVAQSRIHKFRI